MDTPDIRYARSGDVSIGYQVVGNGPVDLLFVPFLINLIWAWEQPIFVDFVDRMKSFSRLILFDKRGTGLSDRPRDLPTLETRMDDIRAVMDDVGSERAALLGAGSPGGQLSALFAATYPERVVALILQNTWPRVVEAPDFPVGAPVEEWRRRVRETRLRWGDREYQRNELRKYFPTRADDPEFEQWHVMHERLAASPGSAAWFMRALMETDIREVLPTISVPTMIMFNAKWREGCIYMAERIPNAKLLELTGPDLSIYGDAQVPVAVERFLAEGHVDLAPERVLTTVLFTDIVDSTSRAADLGDARWRELLEAHHATVRAQLARYGGNLVRSTGDGVCATFDGPARAITCAHGMRGLCATWVSTSERASTPARSSSCAAASRASRSTSRHASPPRPGRAKSSSRASCATLRAAPGSSSRSAACTISRASPASGRCLRLDSASAPD